MATREIYFKNVMSSDLPAGMVFYVYKDDEGIVRIGKSICLKFSTEENIVKESVEKMKEIEQSKGFMFWNVSEEGESFFKENRNILTNYLLNRILRIQK